MNAKEIQQLKKEYRKVFNCETPQELGNITLSNSVWITDPCYSRDTRCQGRVDDLVPGVYCPIITYKEGRVASLVIYKQGVYSSPLSEPMRNLKALPFEVGVDSGQAGIFCDSIYPTEENTGEYDAPGFYGDCCRATLGQSYDDMNNAYRCIYNIEEYSKQLQSNVGLAKDLFEGHIRSSLDEFNRLLSIASGPYIQGGTILDKGVVSSTGRGDGSYTAYMHKNKDMIIIRYL